MGKLATLFSLVLAADLAGCAVTDRLVGDSALEGSSWTLAVLPGSTLAEGAAPTLQFQGGRVHGSDGCNRYSAPYSVKGSAIELTARAAATLMACPPQVQRQAAAFMGVLGSARSYRLDGRNLHLMAADGALLATFLVQSQDVAGTSWRVTAINNGKNAVANVHAGTSVTLDFGTEGRAAGLAGCNRYTAGYRVDGARLGFAAPAATRMMCLPPGVMQQEQAFLKALEAVVTSRIEAGRLELRAADGALLVSAVRASEP